MLVLSAFQRAVSKEGDKLRVLVMLRDARPRDAPSAQRTEPCGRPAVGL
jgi:hypothetical protein